MREYSRDVNTESIHEKFLRLRTDIIFAAAQSLEGGKRVLNTKDGERQTNNFPQKRDTPERTERINRLIISSTLRENARSMMGADPFPEETRDVLVSCIDEVMELLPKMFPDHDVTKKKK